MKTSLECRLGGAQGQIQGLASGTCRLPPALGVLIINPGMASVLLALVGTQGFPTHTFYQTEDCRLLCFSIWRGAEKAMTFTEQGLTSFGCCFFPFSGAPARSVVSPYSRGARVIHSHIIPRVSNVAELIGEKGSFSGPFPSDEEIRLLVSLGECSWRLSHRAKNGPVDSKLQRQRDEVWGPALPAVNHL